MDFEQMRVIWDSQNEQPLYVLDQQALHATVRRKGRCIEKSVKTFEGLMIAILLAVAVILVGKRVLSGPEWQTSMVIGAALTLLVAVVAAVNLALGRARRLKRERVFDESIVGDIDKALSQVDYQVARLKNIHYWFLLPMAAMIGTSFMMRGVSLAELFGSKIWVGPLFLLAILINYAAVWLEMRWFHRPRKRSLQALREKLVAEE